MAANTVPIYTRTGQIEWNTANLTTANTAKDGTGTVAVIFTADATNGGRVERVRAIARGTNVATVLRIFTNNGGTNTVAANNTLYANKSIAATTNSETAALLVNELPDTVDTTAFPLVLPIGHRLLATIGTTVASGLSVTAIGGSY